MAVAATGSFQNGIKRTDEWCRLGLSRRPKDTDEEYDLQAASHCKITTSTEAGLQLQPAFEIYNTVKIKNAQALESNGRLERAKCDSSVSPEE